MKGAHPEKNMTFHLNHIYLTVGKSKIFSSDQFDMQVLKKLYKKKIIIKLIEAILEC